MLRSGTDPFGWYQNQTADAVMGQGVTNQAGFFRLDERLVRGGQYAFVAFAPGFRVEGSPSYRVPADADDPHNTQLSLRGP